MTAVLDQHIGEDFALYNADNCQGIKGVPDNSVGLTVSSLPFESLFVYSDSEADIGNSQSSEEFFEHMGFLIPELLRVTIPGRLCCMHCKHLSKSLVKDGEAGVRDFPGEIIRAFEKAGWALHGPPITIWKDPVTEMQRTNNHGLLYKALCKDSSVSRQGLPDYIIPFRKPMGGRLFSDHPVCNGSNPERFDRYVGMSPPNAGEIAERCGVFPPTPNSQGQWPKVNPFPEGSDAFRVWSITVWQKYASPVWMDIDQQEVLSFRGARDERDERHLCPLLSFRGARDERDERHLCPLQTDVIERCIHLWSNPGDVVLDPFMGVGSTAFVATKTGRKALGMELKPSYWRQSVKHLEHAAKERNRPQLEFGSEE